MDCRGIVVTIRNELPFKHKFDYENEIVFFFFLNPNPFTWNPSAVSAFFAALVFFFVYNFVWDENRKLQWSMDWFRCESKRTMVAAAVESAEEKKHCQKLQRRLLDLLTLMATKKITSLNSDSIRLTENREPKMKKLLLPTRL